ncbi:hypothetical protein BC940DRAFT_297109, partial [Gongronella butleri]
MKMMKTNARLAHTLLLLRNNGDHSLHGNLLLRKKCPLKLIDFYEDHIMFRKD